MRIDERQARHVLLAQAIETTDREGRLITDAERDALDVAAIDEARRAGAAKRDIAAALVARAERVLEIVGRRDPLLASLSDVPAWRQSVVWGLPFFALLLGVLTDQVANPHRIDLLSIPLIAIVLWNVVVYVALAVRALRPRGERASLSAFRALMARFVRAPRRLRHLPSEVRTKFIVYWQRVSARLQGHRAALILHLCAAAWAAGVALSLFVRGLVVEYRVGWESTFLSAEQVQWLLKLLFWPVLAIASFGPFPLLSTFSLADIQALRFDAGAAYSVENGRRWVYLYAGLLALVVVVPRLLLATLAWLRVGVASRRLTIDLADPYFQQLIDRLIPSRVALAVRTHRDPDRTALARVLQQHAERDSADVLIRTPTGDELQMTDSRPPLPQLPAPAETRSESRWLALRSRLLGDADETERSPVPPADVVLHVIGDEADLETPVDNVAAPALLLVRAQQSADATPSRLLEKSLLHRKHHEDIGDVLAFDEFARCWAQDTLLLDAIGRSIPRSKTQGYGRLAAAWEARNRARLRESMSILSGMLAGVARDTEEVKSAPLSVRTLFSKEQRAARTDAKTEAMAAVVERLKVAQDEASRELLALHRVADSNDAERIEQGLEVKVDMRSAVDTREAGLAGAASGAAMGASVDLVTGGLTLGVAALLGALVGGSAALLSAAWNNRKSPSGASMIQLSDEMLQTLLEASLLRYLAVIHLRGDPVAGANGDRSGWNSEVVAMVAAQRDVLQPVWTALRNAPSPATVTEAASRLAQELQTIATKVLRNLYPKARLE